MSRATGAALVAARALTVVSKLPWSQWCDKAVAASRTSHALSTSSAHLDDADPQTCLSYATESADAEPGVRCRLRARGWRASGPADARRCDDVARRSRRGEAFHGGEAAHPGRRAPPVHHLLSRGASSLAVNAGRVIAVPFGGDERLSDRRQERPLEALDGRRLAGGDSWNSRDASSITDSSSRSPRACAAASGAARAPAPSGGRKPADRRAAPTRPRSTRAATSPSSASASRSTAASSSSSSAPPAAASPP